VKEISFEEKKKFMESKLTEEEIGEVMRRYNAAINNKTSTKTTDPVFANITGSPQAETRLMHQQSLLMQSINVASVAVLTTLGVSYVLDKLKDKQDRNLREELKDRVESTLRDSTGRIRVLESE